MVRAIIADHPEMGTQEIIDECANQGVKAVKPSLIYGVRRGKKVHTVDRSKLSAEAEMQFLRAEISRLKAKNKALLTVLVTME
jgi:hypothetical protein